MDRASIKLNRLELSVLKQITSSIKIKISLIILIYLTISIIILAKPISAIFLIPILSFILSGFINAAHFYLHRADISFKSRNLIGRIWCTPILANYTAFKYKHYKHHKKTGVSGDPDLQPEFNNIYEYLYLHSGIRIWYNTIKNICTRLVWDRYSLNKKDNLIHKDNLIIFIWLVFTTILACLFPKPFFLCYLIPLLLYPTTIVFFSLPEHYGLDGHQEIILNTRTITSNSIVRYFQWSANFHVEHHYYPSIPTINLHLIHNTDVAPVINIEKSYLLFHICIIKKLLKRSN